MTDMPYDANAWMAETTQAGHVFNYNYRMTGNELRGWELVKTVEMRTGPDLLEIAYIWQKQGDQGEVLVRVDVGEAKSWREAQALLQGHLQHTMRPAMAGGAGAEARLGDVGFSAKAPDTDTEAAVFFSVGNVVLTVRSVGSNPVDVAPIASTLNCQLGQHPAADAPSPLRRIRREPLRLEKDRSVPVVEQLPQPVARSGWLKLIASSGEFHREDRQIIFDPYESGEQPIEEYRTGM